MRVKVFDNPVQKDYSVCAVLEDGTADPHYQSIPDIKHKGEANYIADRINEAYRIGQYDKAKEIRRALNIFGF